ncbi:MAG: HEPN domain-containing protein [Rhodocyclaceae bacterium]|nr:HEPN domain-containing protein [Rhodocyclaceae bacterium]
MKKNREEALRWLDQAEYDLESAKRNYENEIYAYACFMCEQSAQKTLKAYLYFKGERYIWEHSIQKLVEKCKNYDEEITKFLTTGAILDKYYLTTRYPDAIAPPAVPYQSFTRKEAEEAIHLTSELFLFVKNKIIV